MNKTSNKIMSFLKRREVRLAAMALCFAVATTTVMAGGAANPAAQTLAVNLQTEGQPWIYWTLRIVAGMMAVGGLLALVSGFTGNEEGYGKAAKVGVGLLLMTIGVYVLINTATVYGILHLDQLFTAA